MPPSRSSLERAQAELAEAREHAEALEAARLADASEWRERSEASSRREAVLRRQVDRARKQSRLDRAALVALQEARLSRRLGRGARRLREGGARKLRSLRQLASWTSQPSLALSRTRAFFALRRSPHFDRRFYVERNPDVGKSGMNPVMHYIEHGAAAGLDPGPGFSTGDYVAEHAELEANDVNPLYHYLRSPEGREAPAPRPHPSPDPRALAPSPADLDTGPGPPDDRADAARAELQRSPLSVSVVIPTYNRVELLQRALLSALYQSYPALELIVCDDGSAEDVEGMLRTEFAAELEDGTIRYQRSAVRRGSAAARNEGLARARGDLVAYLDSDNAWHPDFLLLLAGALAKHDDAATAYCGYTLRSDGEDDRPRFERYDRARLLVRNYVDLNTFVHRRRLFGQLGGFDEQLTRLVDWELILRYTGRYPPVTVSELLVDYDGGESGDRVTYAEEFEPNAERIRRLYAHERVYSGISPLRLAYVLWDYPALSQTFVLGEIEQLVKDGYDVHVYYKEAPDRAATVNYDVPTFQVADAAELAELLARDERTLIHSHFAYPAVTLLAWPAATLAGIPFTFTVHAVDVFHEANRERNRIAEVARDQLCVRVFAIGEFHRGYLADRDVPLEKISITRPCAVLDFASEDSIESRLVRDGRVVACITRFVEKKGVDQLIRAAPLLGPGTEVRLYGYGPMAHELEALASEIDARNVRFMGPIDDRGRLAEALAEADAFALPCVVDGNGDMDGLPTVIGEAMAAGVPVVTTELAAIPEVIEDGLTGVLAKPADPRGLARRIDEVLGWPAERKRQVIESATARARETWNPRETLDTLLDAWIRPPLDIAMVSFCRGDESGAATTAEIVRRIKRLTTSAFALTIVDNDSDPGHRETLVAAVEEMPNATLLLLDENRHWGPALNLALRDGRSDQALYVCSNEGFVLRPGWERRFVSYMRANRDVAIAGHIVSSPGFPRGSDYLDQPWFEGFRNKSFAERNPQREFGHVQGGLFALRRDAYERCGMFSEATKQEAADVEYSYHVESLGWKLGEVGSMPSLTTKTRPPLHAHLDERTMAAHPLTLDAIDGVAALVDGKTGYCNFCEWAGEWNAADDQPAICPACRSTPFGRLLFRYLADTALPYRGAGCLAARCDPAATEQLARMFELTTAEIPEIARQDCRFAVIAADLATLAEGDQLEPLGAAIASALSEEGLALLGLPRRIASEAATGRALNGGAPSANGDERRSPSGLERGLIDNGLELELHRPSSRAVRFPREGVLVARHPAQAASRTTLAELAGG